VLTKSTCVVLVYHVLYIYDVVWGCCTGCDVLDDVLESCSCGCLSGIASEESRVTIRQDGIISQA